jgi:hypothetical protein
MNKRIIVIIVCCLVVFIIGNSCNCKVYQRGFNKNKDILKSSNKNDSIINLLRENVIDLIKVNELAELAEFEINKFDFYPIYIYDIQDTSSYCRSCIKNLINFEEGRIYHFSALNYRYLYSNVCVLDGDSIKVFLALNCEMQGDSYVDIKDYLTDKGYSIDEVESLISKMRSFKNIVPYRRSDNYTSIKCR